MLELHDGAIDGRRRGAVPPNVCGQQRAEFPASWNDVSKETPLGLCRGHYVRFDLFAEPKQKQKHLTIRIHGEHGAIYRSDQIAAEVLRKGGTIVLRAEKSCFVRGSYSDAALLSLTPTEQGGLRGAIAIPASEGIDVVDACELSLGIDPDPSTGGIGSGVTYIAFTGTGAVANPIEDHQAAVTLGQSLATTLLQNN